MRWVKKKISELFLSIEGTLLGVCFSQLLKKILSLKNVFTRRCLLASKGAAALYKGTIT